MATRKIETEISLSGERQFNDQMKAVNSNLKTLKSSMAVVSSEFLGNANSVDALRAKQAVLQDQYDQQAEKVRALNEMLEKAKDAYGEDSAQVDKYKQQLNNATVQLNTFGRDLDQTNKYLEEAEKSTDGTAKSIDGYGKEVKDADSKTRSFGDTLKSSLISLAQSAANKGLEGLKEKLKGFAQALKDLPVTVLKESAQALASMGKAAYEATINAAAYADEVLTTATNTGLSTQAIQEYQYMAELTDTSLETITGSMAKLTKNMDSARKGTGTAKDAFAALGVEITNTDGTLRDNNEVFGEVITRLGEMENETERDAMAMSIFGRSAQDLNSLIAVGADGLAAYREEAHAAGAVMSDDMLESLGAVDDALQRFKQTLAAAKNALGAEFAKPVEKILNGLTKVLQGDIESGLDMIIDGIDEAEKVIDKLLPMAEELLTELLQKFVERLPDMITAGTELITSLILGIAETLPDVIPKMIEAVILMVKTLTSEENLSKLVESGVMLIANLAAGLVENFPELVEAVIKAIATVIKTLWDNRGQIVESGKDLLKALWEGIEGMGDWLKEKVANLAARIAALFHLDFKTAFSSNAEAASNTIDTSFSTPANADLYSGYTHKSGKIGTAASTESGGINMAPTRQQVTTQPTFTIENKIFLDSKQIKAGQDSLMRALG